MTSDKIFIAEAKAAYWLAEANDRQENGLSDEVQMRKAQFWLDRANKLRRWGTT